MRHHVRTDFERVVVTGMGAVTPIGNSVDQFWNALIRGESGITEVKEFPVNNLKSRIAGIVKHFNVDSLIGRNGSKKIDRFCQFALVASDQAIKDSGLPLEQMNRSRIGIYVGSAAGGIKTLLEQAEINEVRGPHRVSPALSAMMISNMAPALISMKYGIYGPTISPVTACSIGNTAIGEAYRSIRYGELDAVIAGATEAPINNLSLASFGNAAAISSRNHEPTRASRPFDANRDGFVLAEGAGILVLESLTHALQRGAYIHAEVIGYGTSSDAFHMVMPHPEGVGAYNAMKMAIQEAKINLGDIDVISAHATSTRAGDRIETLAIKKLFGERAARIPITGNKSMTGHSMGASSSLEAIALIKTLQHNIIPPTINQEEQDPECDLDYVPNFARENKMRIGISNSFGFGGHNAVIAMRAFNN
ncbi:3-oxoacyl-[acyl-carrier-protein] synthase 2 [Paenibacillus glycanilyticus]|uniref:3-oxoacyl-[acyl-carrier-protein] synthase 2 n=1 Tax=Paenibacillus glycanilyticus TaxID=126569 RepID=A0ABQ6NSC1_9BACL|nr:beta-ketoacyl-ACP synthase II [Paenibacillus glycanilyticus]GMK47453.1 3-oxoacyl-[acyl-carrier-protein] synthase 2 [Paenibacillus glycanilyticus]